MPGRGIPQPAGQMVPSGGTVTLRVGCQVSPLPLHYQWQCNGVGVPGATNASLTLTGFQSNHWGVYRVVINNALGTATSAQASLLEAQMMLSLPLDQVWKYDQSGTDLGTAWREVDFDDRSWLEGPGVLAVEDNPAVTPWIRTTLSLTNAAGQKITTYYFRTRFTWDGEAGIVSLVASNLVEAAISWTVNGKHHYWQASQDMKAFHSNRPSQSATVRTICLC